MADLKPSDEGKPPKPIKDEIASVGIRDITIGYIGNILLNPDTVLATEGRGAGLKIYEDLERDDKVYAALQTRKTAVSGKEWQVTPASEEGADVDIAAFIEKTLLALPFGDIIKSLLDAKLKGFAVAEVLWKVSHDGKIGIHEIIGRDQRRFTFALDRSLRLLTPQHLLEGEEVPDRKFIVLSSGSKIGNPFGSGLGSRLYWPVWFKKNGIRFWSIYLEKFGSPTVVGKYPPGTEKPQRDALLKAIEAIQQEAAVTIPDNIIIELLESQRRGTTDSYKSFMAYWDKSIAIVTLGQSLTTDVGDSGSRALGDVHNEVRLDLVKDDADDIAEALNCQLIPWLVDFNFPGVTEYPKFWIRTEPEKNLLDLAERDERLVTKIGLPIAKKYFYDTYDIPEPAEDEELVSPSPPDTGNETKGGIETSAFARAINQSSDSVDPLVDRLMLEADLNPMIDPIAKLVAEADSLEDLKDRLLDRYKEMDPVHLGDLLQQALATAELAGRFEATEEDNAGS